MNQTPNYQLNQWEKSDRIRMEDFNADNAKIEAALAAAVAAANAEHIVVGSYTGNGAKNRVISLSFTPKFVILLGTIASGNAITIATDSTERYVVSTGCGSANDVRVVENGFKVGISGADWHNKSGTTETYIAVR